MAIDAEHAHTANRAAAKGMTEPITTEPLEVKPPTSYTEKMETIPAMRW